MIVWSPVLVPDRLVAVIPDEFIVSLGVPAIVACRSVPSPPKPVVLAHL